MAATGTNDTSESLFLSQWIRRAIDGVDLSAIAARDFFSTTSFGVDPTQWPANFRKSIALRSDDYLLSALRVAHSLAEQLCEAEDFAAQDEDDGHERDIVRENNIKGLPSLPPPGSSWTDTVLVHLLLKGNDEANDANRLYFNIQLLASSTEKGHLKDRMKRIYYLGMVFYEIFSGGERPPERNHSQTKTEELSPELSQELSGNLDPLPIDHDGRIDISGEIFSLSIFDEVAIPDTFNVQDVNNNLVRNPGKRQMQNVDNHTVSVESLKEKGIPRSLCDLVANMMNCVDDTVCGEDTYENISQVRNDLQLMLQKPAIYLYDQDMGRFAAFGLNLSETIYGRDAELSTVMDAYRRSVSGENKLVIISGSSGSGKSFLAHKIGMNVVAEGGIQLFGKFDQLQQGKPFSALASAFNQLCGTLINNDGLYIARQEVACQVRSVIGREAYHLTKIIPNLSIILGSDSPGFNHDEDCVNSHKRLQYLLCRFVEVLSISMSAGRVVTIALCLDDVQWADTASMEAVSQLLLDQHTPFFFLGCCREGQITKGHSAWKLLCIANESGVGCTNVKLDCMDEEAVNAMVSETLSLSPRLTRALSDIIYHKTKGNPLFVVRMMLSLTKEGLLRASLSRRRWEWDKEKIQCQKIPDDVAMFLANSITMQPEDVKQSLRVLSCFGASVEIALIRALETALDKKLLDSLDVAVTEGFLDKVDDQYRFSHDRIQEAAYNQIDFIDRRVRHFQYGKALANHLIGVKDDGILFTAVNQLNLGGPEATTEHKNQNIFVANLNLRAGKMAMEMSDFGTAYSYFDSGISFLGKNHWTEHYNLSLELCDLASKCALTNGDVDSLKLLSDQVLLYGHSFEHKLNVLYCATCAMAFSSKLPEAIEKVIDILAQLGIDLRGYDSSIEACLQETKDFLSGHTDDDILNTGRMIDPTKIMAMKFLGKLEMGSTQIMPESVPAVTQKIIKLSLLHGMSPVSPVGFAYFGSCLAKLGDISGGCHYVKLALSLLDKVGSRESAGEVICIGTQVRAFVEPIQAVLEYHDDGYVAAMVSGDIRIASINSFLSFGSGFFAGVSLQIMQEKYVKIQKMLEERKQVILMIQMQQFRRSIFKLIGIEEEPNYGSEEESILATNNSVLRVSCFHKAYVNFMFRTYGETKEYAEKYIACRDKTWATLFYAEAVQALYIGLISFWLARMSRSQEEHQQWYQVGNKAELALKRWAESSQWTFENKWYLMRAEDSFCNNDFVAAESFYEKAISSAETHKVR
jgi:predicted ATPase